MPYVNLFDLCMVNIAYQSPPEIRQGPGSWVVTQTLWIVLLALMIIYVWMHLYGEVMLTGARMQLRGMPWEKIKTTLIRHHNRTGYFMTSLWFIYDYFVILILIICYSI